MNGLPIGHTTPPLNPGNGYRVKQSWQPYRFSLMRGLISQEYEGTKEKQIHKHIHAQLENMSLPLQSEESVRSCQ